MNTTYPQRAKCKNTSLDGFWDFVFLGDEIDINVIDLQTITYPARAAVPGVFDTGPDLAGKRGTALYRCFIDVEPDHQAILSLGGIGIWGQIFVDGKLVSTIALPYSGVEVELPRSQKRKRELVILIDNRFDFERSPLISQFYDFYAYGGIYRSVNLRQPPETAIKRVRVTPLDINTGLIRADIILSGELPEALDIAISFDDGMPTVYREKVVNGKLSLELTVPDFKLWSPANPNLHTITVSTSNDDITERFGLRLVEARDGQILLNGHPQKLLGFCRHESDPRFGPALPDKQLLDDLHILKDLGCNFIRGVHYPMNQRFLDLCDEFGFLVWEESLAWGEQPDNALNPYFQASQLEQTGLMVQNSYNHPSIILWGFMNECCSDAEEIRDLYVNLFATIRKVDSSRLVTYASNRYSRDLCFDLCDVISFNIYPGWYSGDLEKVAPIDEITPAISKHAHNIDNAGFMDKPFIISEIGAGAIYGWRDHFRVHWSEEYQADYLKEVCQNVLNNPRVNGLAIWHFADCRTYCTSRALQRPRAFNNKGILDEYRRPKLAYDVVKAMFNDANRVIIDNKPVYQPESPFKLMRHTDV